MLQSTESLHILGTRPVATEKPLSVLSARGLIRVVLPVAVIVVWQAMSLYDPGQMPSPTDVWKGFGELYENGSLGEALGASLTRALIGLAFGLVIGISAGLLTGLYRVAEELLDSTFQIVRLLPFVALAPLFIIWFGIGEAPKIYLIALATVFPAYLNTYSGVRHVDPKLKEAAIVFGLKPLALSTQVIIPAALPSILVGVRYAMGIALLALIVAEQINAKSGIGYIIYLATGSVRIDLIMVAIVVYAILGVIVDILMRAIERLSMPWIPR